LPVHISVLTDNTASYGYLAEWGLSLFVRTENNCLLLDTGFTETAVHNSAKLGVNLASADLIVLSHGHRDHTGGLLKVLSRSGGKPVLCHPSALESKVSRRNGQPERRIGIPFTKIEIESLGANLKFISEPGEIVRGVLASGEVPMTNDFETIDESLYHEAMGALAPDPCLDDLSLAFPTGEGLVIVLGCAHRGAINIIRHFQDIAGESRVQALVGGMHLTHASEGRLSSTVQTLKELGARKLVLGHCTGFHAMARLAHEFGEAFVPMAAGTTHIFPD
jgi:7,8-dihydropterin-6-yl-methyl-4-(beta-D-ribofuranosyl)aminobenzene 5'-phosphate synthase